MKHKTIKTVYNKLAKDKTDLKTHKVDLSLVDDIDSEFDWLENSYTDAFYGIEFMREWEDKIMDFNTELSIAVDNYVVNGAAYSFEEAYTNMRTKIEELETKAEELGMNPSELIRNYEDIKDILNSAESVDSEFKSAYKEVLRQANERFGLADFS